MEPIAARIIQVVEEAGGNKSEFARKIDVTPAYISKLGKQPEACRPSNLVIKRICREFSVNEDWLRTGEGDMFLPSPNGALDELARKHGLSGRGKVIVERFLGLKPDIQEALADYIEEVASAFSDAGGSSPVDTQAKGHFEAEARAKAELYYQQLLLEQEQERQASSAKEQGAG